MSTVWGGRGRPRARGGSSSCHPCCGQSMSCPGARPQPGTHHRVVVAVGVGVVVLLVPLVVLLLLLQGRGLCLRHILWAQGGGLRAAGGSPASRELPAQVRSRVCTSP